MDKNKPPTPQLSEWRTHSVYGGSLQPAPQRTRAVFATEVTSNLCCYRHVKSESCCGPLRRSTIALSGITAASLSPNHAHTPHLRTMALSPCYTAARTPEPLHGEQASVLDPGAAFLLWAPVLQLPGLRLPNRHHASDTVLLPLLVSLQARPAAMGAPSATISLWDKRDQQAPSSLWQRRLCLLSYHRWYQQSWPLRIPSFLATADFGNGAAWHLHPGPSLPPEFLHPRCWRSPPPTGEDSFPTKTVCKVQKR